MAPSAAKKKSSKKKTARRKTANKNTPRQPQPRRIPRLALVALVFALLVSLFVLYLFLLDRQIVARFEGRLWAIPAKVYARPLELYEGRPLTGEQLEYELELLAYNSTTSLPTEPGSVHHWRNNHDIVTRGYRFWDMTDSTVRARVRIEDGRVASLTDLSSGEPLALLRLEPAYIDGIFPQHGEDRILVTLEEVPDALIKMLVLTEDRRFFEHIGVDPQSIARAMLANLKAGRTVQGGSTLTQQLVKNLYLSSERSLLRKINEAFMSLLLELHYDKRTILQTYLNEVYLGQDRDRAIHGFGLASEYYFRKELSALDYDQLALLVAMVKGASYYHPVRNQERAKLRRDTILMGMRDENLITDDQYRSLKQRDIAIAEHRKRSKHPAFMELVRKQLAEFYDEDDLQAEGLQVYTTMDPYVQRQAEAAVTTTLQRDFADRDSLEAALVTAAHSSGDVLAVIGGADPGFPGFNRALDARRQVGSLIKPVVYLAALSEPSRFTLASVIEDSEVSLTNELGAVWEPQNYDREFHGDILLFDALLRSLNVPAVKTGLAIGLGAIDKTWRALGGQQALRPLPSITLGAIEASPFELAGIYQSLAADGFDTPLNSVYAVLDKHGEPLSRNSIAVRRDVSPQAVGLMNFVLSEVAKQGTARRLAAELDIAVAGKTGTSDDTRDSWFAGFSGELVTVAWIGYDDNSPTGLTGSSGAMRIWSRLYRNISTGDYRPRLAVGTEVLKIDRDSGLLGGSGCENNVELPFIAGSGPQQSAECADQGSGSWLDRLFGD